jgi:hypothetical protein
MLIKVCVYETRLTDYKREKLGGKDKFKKMRLESTAKLKKRLSGSNVVCHRSTCNRCSLTDALANYAIYFCRLNKLVPPSNNHRSSSSSKCSWTSVG